MMAGVPFDAVLDALRSHLAATGAPCLGIEPRADGSLAFSFQVEQIQAIIALVPLPATDVSGMPAGQAPFRLMPDKAAQTLPQGAALARQLRDALVLHMPQDLGAWLTPGSDPHARTLVPRCVSGLAHLLGERFAPGRAFWRGWRLARLWFEVDRGLDGFRLHFAGPDGMLVLHLGDVREPGKVLSETPLGALRVLASQGQTPLDAVAFLLRRCVAGPVAWSGAPSARDPQDDWKDGLLDGSYRGSVEWYMRPSRFFGMWGYPDSFGLVGELGRRQCVILHASRECPMVVQVTARQVMGSVRPWGEESIRQGPDELAVYTTDIDDLSIALGGEAKLSRLYDRVAADAKGPVDAMMAEGCESHIIGDSPDAVGERCLHGTQVKLSVLQPRMPSFEEGDTRSSWARFLDGVAQHGASARQPHTVNLVGFGHPDDAAVRDTVQLLDSVGIRVATVTMPFLDVRAESDFASAALSVVSPWQPVRELFTEPLMARNLPHLEVAMPYGWEGTLRWLSAVCATLDLPAPDAARQSAWQARLADAAGAPQAKLEAEPFRFAMVYDKGSLSELLAPRFLFGAELHELLGGPGVRVTVVHAPNEVPAQPTDPALIARLTSRGIRFVEHTPTADPLPLLRDEDFEAIYCDVGDGDLAKRAGAVPVHIGDFHIGLAGHAATLRRLTLWRNLNLYRRYGRWIESPC